MPSSRRRSRTTAPSGAREPAKPPAKPPASPWSAGGLPLVPLTIVAVLVGGLLVGLLVGLNAGGRNAAVGNAASASPGGSAAAAASASASSGPASSPLPIIAPIRSTPPDLAHGRTIGSADAPVQLDVWSDFQCPACDAFTGSVEPFLIETYIRPGIARLTYHDLATIGEESLGGAIAARCADRQGQFWPYHDLLFANQAEEENSGVLTRERTADFARSLGLDMDAFATCLADVTVQAAVSDETEQGLAGGITETPTLYVNGDVVKPATSSASISAAIAAALQSVSPSPGP